LFKIRPLAPSCLLQQRAGSKNINRQFGHLGSTRATVVKPRASD
jgi:hypothetical protein